MLKFEVKIIHQSLFFNLIWLFVSFAMNYKAAVIRSIEKKDRERISTDGKVLTLNRE